MGKFLRVMGVSIFTFAFLFLIASTMTDKEASLKQIEAAYGGQYERLRAAELSEQAASFRITAGIALVASLIILGISAPLVRTEKAAKESKKCPHCAELVKKEALKCRFCGHEFPLAETAAEEQAEKTRVPGRMIDCPHCRRQIPRAVNRCPFCRHDVRGG